MVLLAIFAVWLTANAGPQVSAATATLGTLAVHLFLLH